MSTSRARRWSCWGGSILLYPDDPEKAYTLPDLPADCWYLTSTGEKSGSVALESGTLTYAQLCEYIASKNLDGDNLRLVRPLHESAPVITVEFYTEGTQYYWDRELIATLHFEEGQEAKSIPAIEERPGQSGYWQGFNADSGDLWSQVRFADAQSLTYEECLEIIGWGSTDQGSATIRVCVRYEAEPLVKDESRVVVHLLLNWGDPIELGTVVTSSTTPDAATPLTYVLPTGLRLNGWNVGGEDTQGSAQWPRTSRPSPITNWWRPSTTPRPWPKTACATSTPWPTTRRMRPTRSPFT